MRYLLPLLWVAAAVRSAGAMPMVSASVATDAPVPAVSVYLYVEETAVVATASPTADVTSTATDDASSTDSMESALESAAGAAVDALLPGEEEPATTINCGHSGHDDNSASDIASALQSGAITAIMMFIMFAGMILLMGLGATCLLKRFMSQHGNDNHQTPDFAERGGPSYFDFDFDPYEFESNPASPPSYNYTPPSQYPALSTPPSVTETALSPRKKGGFAMERTHSASAAPPLFGLGRPRLDMAEVARMVALSFLARSRFVEGLPSRGAVGFSPPRPQTPPQTGTLIPDL
ncbi:hypothetical protein F5Y15DRAFT_54912 [Xylariaceae sp. FL0016]|nr:hypothetical protein F5Y15DRAFT_54912 [Xylariaceae sp. FL0016]